MPLRFNARAQRAVVAFAALLAVLPLLLRGPSCGHDFDFHLLSWLEAAQQIAHGGYPHWAYTPALNAGEPRFLFYPPLSWALGALLGLALPWQYVPAAFTFVALLLCGLSARRMALEFAAPGAATLAAIAYLANPYMLFCAYERTAYGELLAAAWLPLLFAAALAPRVRALTLAMPVALLWLTNVPVAVMGCYALALLLAARLILPAEAAPQASPRRRLRLAATACGGVLLGFALSAFYLAPAVAERPFVQAQLATGVGMRVLDSTLFHHMTPVDSGALLHDAILRTASWIALGLLGAVLLLGAALLHRKRDATTIALLGMAGCIAFLLTPLSLRLWPHIPELVYLQFPWRMCALLAAAAALLLARLLPRTLPPGWVLACSLLVLAACVPPAWASFAQHCDDDDSVAGRTALFHSADGTEAMDEYTPLHADDDVQPRNPPYWTYCAEGHDHPDEDDVPPPTGAAEGQAPTHLALTVPCPSLLVLNRRQYPSWRVLVGGKAVAPSVHERQDGLITVPLPAGPNTVDLVFARTPDRIAGIMLSVLAGAFALGLATRAKGRSCIGR